MPDADELPHLSVIIPAYNSESSIARTVRSVLAQASGEIEVLVVDDGSDVDPSSVLAQYIATGRCRVLRQANLGASVARNHGFQVARAALVMFVDADDELVDGSLIPFLRSAQESRADVTISDFYLSDGDSMQLVPAVNSEEKDFGESARIVLQRLTLARIGFGGKANIGLLGAPWAKIYQKDFLVRAFGRDELFTPGVLRGQDVLFNTEVFGKAQAVHYFRQASYVYSVNSDSASHSVAVDFVSRVTTLGRAVEGLILRHGWTSLMPALAKMTVTLLEEAMQRRGRALKIADVRQLLQREMFRHAVRGSQLRDFSLVGRVKLLAYRAGSIPTYVLMKSLVLVRRAGR
ncbi:glycosyltransferase family 2 protein [Curtobacterium citreum]|uniref:glycosyltransferase family 2 protein n=1 Tax=Curtobacterium citreum TaxID=2036 RepID=UPI002543EE2F|nr:glycosyltransferase family 2 protein [Curtobacterium citreum]WIJ45907.1 glycosyltransferase family 2 protein [Curtobacterium citreum]